MGLIQSYILKLIKRVPESSWDFIVESNLCRCSTFAHFQGDEHEKGAKKLLLRRYIMANAPLFGYQHVVIALLTFQVAM